MSRILVAYFSASGVTKGVAAKLASVLGADIFEIVPERPYTKADLNWLNKMSRTTLEMKDRSCRPAIAFAIDNMYQYDTVFLGFPVWWYREPSIIDSFLAAYDFTGKKIVLFATSGGSDIGKEAPARAAEITKAEVLPGKRFSANASADELKTWAAMFSAAA